MDGWMDGTLIKAVTESKLASQRKSYVDHSVVLSLPPKARSS